MPSSLTNAREELQRVLCQMEDDASKSGVREAMEIIWHADRSLGSTLEDTVRELIEAIGDWKGEKVRSGYSSDWKDLYERRMLDACERAKERLRQETA